MALVAPAQFCRTPPVSGETEGGPGTNYALSFDAAECCSRGGKWPSNQRITDGQMAEVGRSRLYIAVKSSSLQMTEGSGAAMLEVHMQFWVGNPFLYSSLLVAPHASILAFILHILLTSWARGHLLARTQIPNLHRSRVSRVRRIGALCG